MSAAKLLTLQTAAPAAVRRAERERAAMADLRRFKREHGLSCQALADELGCSVDSVERYLTGKSPVAGHVVQYVVEASQGPSSEGRGAGSTPAGSTTRRAA